MIRNVDALVAEVLQLSDSDREALLEQLQRSLPPLSEVVEAWDALAALRDAEIESGAVRAIPGDEALARLRAQLGR
jgi:hypothetical protein